MTFGVPGLESIDTEGVLRLLKISEFNEWLATAMSPETQAVQSDETFEVNQEAGGVSSSASTAEPITSSIAQVTEPTPSPHGITSESRAAQAHVDSGTPIHLQAATIDEELLPPQSGRNISERSRLPHSAEDPCQLGQPEKRTTVHEIGWKISAV
jgi:hypothetical protein